jgi:hypothetical protein
MERKYAFGAARNSRITYLSAHLRQFAARPTSGGFAGAGIYGSERNPNFIAECEKDIKKVRLHSVRNYTFPMVSTPGAEADRRIQAYTWRVKQASYRRRQRDHCGVARLRRQPGVARHDWLSVT